MIHCSDMIDMLLISKSKVGSRALPSLLSMLRCTDIKSSPAGGAEGGFACTFEVSLEEGEKPITSNFDPQFTTFYIPCYMRDHVSDGGGEKEEG